MSLDAGTIPLPDTRSNLGVSQDTSDEESLADSEFVAMTSVQGERYPGDSPMHTNYGAKLPSAPGEVSCGPWAMPTGK